MPRRLRGERHPDRCAATPTFEVDRDHALPAIPPRAASVMRSDGGASRLTSSTTAHSKRIEYDALIRDRIHANLSQRMASPTAAGVSPARSHLDMTTDAERQQRAQCHALVDDRAVRSDVVDWGFCHAHTILDLRTTKPRSGSLFVRNGARLARISAEQEAQERRAKIVADQQRLDAIYTFGESSKAALRAKQQQADDGLTILKARGETYAFVDKPMTLDDGRNASTVDTINRWRVRNQDGEYEDRVLVGDALQEFEEQMQLYRCTILRLNHNLLTSVEHLGPDLRQLLFRPSKFLSIVDLSCNRIRTLPTDVDGIPLHTLLLHSNRIADFAEVSKLAAFAPSLRKLTLYENPVQANPALYRVTIIALLPGLTSLDDATVTNKDKADATAPSNPRHTDRASRRDGVRLPPLLPKINLKKAATTPSHSAL